MEQYPTFKTRGGQTARIYAQDGGGEHPIHGAYWNADTQRWTPMTWNDDGFFIDKTCPRDVDILNLNLD